MASVEYARYFAVIRKIPQGRVMTYGDVAKAAGCPRWARRVGYALASCNDRSVPWWRVINAQGEISSGGGRSPGSAGRQKRMLEAEGVYIDLSGRIDLDVYRHRPGSPVRTA